MIDWQRVEELETEIGREDFDEVAALFLSEIEAELAALPDVASDAGALRDRLHAMKGSALNLGFAALADLCAKGEAQAADGVAHDISVDALMRLFQASQHVFRSHDPARVTQAAR